MKHIFIIQIETAGKWKAVYRGSDPYKAVKSHKLALNKVEPDKVRCLKSDGEKEDGTPRWVLAKVPNLDAEAKHPEVQHHSGKEHELWSDTPSQVINIGYYIWCVVLTPVFGLGIFMALWKYFDTSNTHIKLTNERLIIGTGIFSKQVDELELYRVKDTRVNEPFFQRLMGVGEILLATTDNSDAGLAYIRGVKEPRQVREMLRNSIEEQRRRTRTREVDFN